jgi:RNA polymerase sigma factor (sigma-70 family)
MDVRSGGGLPAEESVSAKVEEQWHLVEAICRMHLSGMRSADVDDAIQETFVQFLHADRRRIRDEAGWLVVVATRVCARIHRQRYRRQETAQPLQLVADKADPAEIVVEQLSFGELIATLSPQEREIVVLRYVAQLPYDQIAERLNLTTVNARQIALRARRRLRDALVLIDSDEQ